MSKKTTERKNAQRARQRIRHEIEAFAPIAANLTKKLSVNGVDLLKNESKSFKVYRAKRVITYLAKVHGGDVVEYDNSAGGLAMGHKYKYVFQQPKGHTQVAYLATIQYGVNKPYHYCVNEIEYLIDIFEEYFSEDVLVTLRKYMVYIGD